MSCIVAIIKMEILFVVYCCYHLNWDEFTLEMVFRWSPSWAFAQYSGIPMPSSRLAGSGLECFARIPAGQSIGSAFDKY